MIRHMWWLADLKSGSSAAAARRQPPACSLGYVCAGYLHVKALKELRAESVGAEQPQTSFEDDLIPGRTQLVQNGEYNTS